MRNSKPECEVYQNLDRVIMNTLMGNFDNPKTK